MTQTGKTRNRRLRHAPSDAKTGARLAFCRAAGAGFIQMSRHSPVHTFPTSAPRSQV